MTIKKYRSDHVIKQFLCFFFKSLLSFIFSLFSTAGRVLSKENDVFLTGAPGSPWDPFSPGFPGRPCREKITAGSNKITSPSTRTIHDISR